MENKPTRLKMEWVVVSKRRIYTVIILVVLLLTALGAALRFQLGGNFFGTTRGSSQAVEGARFYTYEGDVRVVRAGTRETVIVDADTFLHPGDIVQTEQNGRASIALADGTSLTIRPNSVITISDNESNGGGGQRASVRVAVDRGQINFRTDRQTPAMSNVVETPLSQNRVDSSSSASFNVQDDRTEEIRVSSGSLATRTRGGDVTTIREGEYLTLNQTGAITKREPLLDAPVPYAPQHTETIALAGQGDGDITLRWTRPQSGRTSDYAIELATSPFFVRAGMIIERDQLVMPELIVTKLRPGSYFWRVRASSPTGQATEWSETQKFTVASAPPERSIHIPHGALAAPSPERTRGP